jgi:hypothetical protein
MEITPGEIAIAAPFLIALVGWVIRSLVIDRIRGLEASNQRQGERIGALEGELKVLQARIQDVRDFSGVVRKDAK